LFSFTGTKSASGEGGMPFTVVQVVIHPRYIHQSPPGPFDIALIRLAGRALNIPFACLPGSGTPLPSNGTPFPNGVCGVAGKYGIIIYNIACKLRCIDPLMHFLYLENSRC